MDITQTEVNGEGGEEATTEVNGEGGEETEIEAKATLDVDIYTKPGE